MHKRVKGSRRLIAVIGLLFVAGLALQLVTAPESVRVI